MAEAQFWTDWQTMVFNSTLGAASGAITFSSLEVATVSYAGQVATPSQMACGFDYFNPTYSAYTDASYTRPRPCEMIAITGWTPASTHRLVFSRPLVDPFMAIVSMGQGGIPVSYDFNAPFDIIDEGAGTYGDGELTEQTGDVLVGREGHGVIRFTGTFTELTWTAGPSEYWHGFTVGASSVAPPESTVPEPMSMVLLGTGLAGVAGAARRRRRKQSGSDEAVC